MNIKTKRLDRKTKRLLLLFVSCSMAGVIIGGASNWVESKTCLQANIVTTDCLTQSPLEKAIKGMSIGLGAGVGAAFGAALRWEQCDFVKLAQELMYTKNYSQYKILFNTLYAVLILNYAQA